MKINIASTTDNGMAVLHIALVGVAVNNMIVGAFSYVHMPLPLD